jgi:hypothetical protein
MKKQILFNAGPFIGQHGGKGSLGFASLVMAD